LRASHQKKLKNKGCSVTAPFILEKLKNKNANYLYLPSNIILNLMKTTITLLLALLQQPIATRPE
jgi:hypothetical protein